MFSSTLSNYPFQDIYFYNRKKIRKKETYTGIQKNLLTMLFKIKM